MILHTNKIHDIVLKAGKLTPTVSKFFLGKIYSKILFKRFDTT